MDDEKPVESGAEMEDSDDSVQENLAPLGNQALPALRQDAPENQELPAGRPAATSSRPISSSQNNELDNIFFSSGHLRRQTNCSQLVDALLSPRKNRTDRKGLSKEAGENLSRIGHQDLPSVEQGQSGHREVSSVEQGQSGHREVSSVEQGQSGHRELASSTEASSVAISQEQNIENLGTDSASPLQSSSIQETTQIRVPRRTARKSCGQSQSENRGLPSGTEASSVSTSQEQNIENLCSDCASPLQSSSIQETTQIGGPRRTARKSITSKSKCWRTNTSSLQRRRSFDTDIESTSDAKKSKTELSESDSGESGPQHESFRSKPIPSAEERILEESPTNAQAREKRIADQEGGTPEPMDGSPTSTKRDRDSSGSSGNESPRKVRKPPSSDDDPSSDECLSEKTSNVESSPSAAEGTLHESQISIGASTASERSEVKNPYLDIHPGQSSASTYHPVVPDDSSTSDRSSATLRDTVSVDPSAVSEDLSSARKCLLDVLKIIDNSVDRHGPHSGHRLAQHLLNTISDPPTDEHETEVFKRLSEFLEQRERAWRATYPSLEGIELMMHEAYEILLRLVVECLISTVSWRTSLGRHSMLLNYRNVRAFYENFSNFWRENNLNTIQDVQDEETRDILRNLKRRIDQCFEEIQQAAIHLLNIILEYEPGVLNLTPEDLIFLERQNRF